MKAPSLERLRPAPEGRAALSNIFLVWGAVAGGAAWLTSILAIFLYPIGLLAIAYGLLLRPTRTALGDLARPRRRPLGRPLRPHPVPPRRSLMRERC